MTRKAGRRLGTLVECIRTRSNLNRNIVREVFINHLLTDIYAYIRCCAALLGERILEEYPALHEFDDAASPRIAGLLRTPCPAQTIVTMGVAKRWQKARAAMVVAECGTRKTLISLGAIHVHHRIRSFYGLARRAPVPNSTH